MKQASAQVLEVFNDEDRAIDAMLAKRAAEVQMDAGAAQALAGDTGVELVKTIDHPELLSEFVENYEPAKDYASLEEQIFLANAHGADSIEAQEIVFKALIGKIPQDSYMVYKGVKVYRIGMIKDGQAKDAQTIEQKVFGKAK